MPFTSINRQIFIAKTRLAVAYSNFSLNMAFGRYPRLENAPRYAAIFGTLAVGFLLVLFAPRIIGGTHNFHAVKITQRKVASLPPPIPQVSIPKPEPTPVSLPNIVVKTPSIYDETPTYVLAVDKSKKVLMVLKNAQDFYEVVKVYEISLGRKIGTKQEAGDLKTPTGLYQIVEVKSGRDLPPYYGPRAFVTNYPNIFDVASGRGGGGIWVHGSKGEKRNLDSHGCVVLDNKNLLKLEAWVGKNTPIAIFPEEFSLPIVDGKLEKKYISTEFFYGEQAKTINRLSDGRGSPG